MLVNSSKLRVQVWRDSGSSETALALGRQPDRKLLHDRDLYDVSPAEGALGTFDHFPSSDDAWTYVEHLYGVSRSDVDRALEKPTRVKRPAGMPARLPTRFSVTTDHFERVSEVRNAVDFDVPDPGARLAGLVRFDLQVTRGAPPIDPGPTVRIWYRSRGVGQTAVVDVVSSKSQEGRAIASGLETDVGPRIRGPHFVANTGDDSYQFKCGDAYVNVSMYVRSLARWRAILTQVARDCPA